MCDCIDPTIIRLYLLGSNITGETPSVVVDALVEDSGADAHDVEVHVQLLILVVHNRVDEGAAAADLVQAEAKSVAGCKRASVGGLDIRVADAEESSGSEKMNGMKAE